jgi:hypothetical protein
MKKLFSLAVILTAVCLLCVSDASAKGKKGAGRTPPTPTADSDFNKLDKNGDGKLTLDEYKADKTDAAEAEKTFNELDKGGKKSLTRDEYKAGWKPSATGAATTKKGKKKK